jgi:hypothetical protein
MVVNTIRERVDSAENGTLFFNNSFLEFDDEYVGKILSDLVKSGELHHLSRGVYLKTEQTRFGLVYPPVSVIASAIAERDKAQILPTGATALNLLGLSTQMPMNPVFLTSGSARTITVDGRTITFKRAVPKNFAVKDKKRSLIVQALKYIGEKNITDDDRSKISELIRKDADMDNLAEDLKVMPVWIRKFFMDALKTNQNE